MNHNFFIIVAMTIILVFLFLYMLNARSAKISQNQFHISMKILKTFTDSIWNRPHHMLYLTHKKNDQIKEEIANAFLKIIILLSEKNREKITNSSLFSHELKSKLLVNLENITILPIERILNINILTIVNAVESTKVIGNRIRLSMTSQLVNIKQAVEDRMDFVQNQETGTLYLDAIWATRYRDQFSNLMDDVKEEV